MSCCYCGTKYPNRICKRCERIELGIINNLLDENYERQKREKLKIYQQSYNSIILQVINGIITKEQFEADLERDIKETLRPIIIKKDDDLIRKRVFEAINENKATNSQ